MNCINSIIIDIIIKYVRYVYVITSYILIP